MFWRELGNQGALLRGCPPVHASLPELEVQPERERGSSVALPAGNTLQHVSPISNLCWESMAEANPVGRSSAGGQGPEPRGFSSPALPGHTSSSCFLSSAPLSAYFPETAKGFVQSIGYLTWWQEVSDIAFSIAACAERAREWRPVLCPELWDHCLPQLGLVPSVLKLLVVRQSLCSHGRTRGHLPAACAHVQLE